MAYLYEHTTPDRFQELTQSLLIDEYPGLQCFPVGQPDGGRDGFHPDSQSVLQVKFKRNDEPESADWMIEALENELPKIKRLVDAGARQYVMITNARGTAHLGGGRMDRVNKWLADHVSIPAHCLWRDDIDRRLDKAPSSLRFRYPEILTGQDGIELALATRLGADRGRQMRAIRAFVGEQFDADAKVKFKQVSLSNSLSDLFIDIPLRFNEETTGRMRRILAKAPRNRSYQRALTALGSLSDELYFEHSGKIERAFRNRTRIGAAEFLLSDLAQSHLKRVILEGAPGQGKSTLAQFVCQVHRAAFLSNLDFQSSVPAMYVQSHFRLPFKVDLRDLAAFVGHDGDQSASLDEFLSELVSRLSGKQKFAVDDLLDVLGSVPALIFLDGLDEVADLEQRRALVAVVERSIQRYETLGLDVQLVVTSRPSVFGKKANFNESGFITVDLASIDRRLAIDYSSKWVKARALDATEGADVLSIFRDKMELSHIVELTRNAMQLTILLSLIHQIGYSLPDQRTDLYRRYLELFLIRESEKDASVKKHQGVLVEFIQYLAWVLQSKSESAGSTGSISEADLQEMARDYLREAKQPEHLAQDLFGGGLERIFVLVQRVTGLYEFEVQPLREFFCARHLYETSPVGTYRYQTPKGDRAQRFEALAANPFWLNVTRFYAGSYEPGEIGSIVMSLKDMISDSDTALSLHGRQVAFALLADWVFTNKKSWQDELIVASCDGPGIHLLLREIYGQGEVFELDEECGRDTLRSLVFDALKDRPMGLNSSGYCSLLAANGGHGLFDSFVSLLEGKTGQVRTGLLVRMLRSGATDSVSLKSVFDLSTVDGPSVVDLSKRLAAVVETQSQRIASDSEVAERIVCHALGGDFIRGSHILGIIPAFVDLLSASPVGAGALAVLNDRAISSSPDAAALENLEGTAALVPAFISRIVQSETLRAAHAFGPHWELNAHVGEFVREVFGDDHWASYALAIRAAGMPTSQSVKEASQMFEASMPLAFRARYARLKRSSVGWWRDSLASADKDVHKRAFWVALVLGWTAPRVFDELLPDVDDVVDGLPSEYLARVESLLVSTARETDERIDRRGHVPRLELMSDRLVWMTILGFRLGPADVSREVKRRNSEFLTAWYSDQVRTLELRNYPKPDASDTVFRNWLKKVRMAQASECSLPREAVDRFRDGAYSAKLASQIVREPGDFPRDSVIRAHAVVMGEYGPPTLTSVAKQQEWSFHD